VRPEQYSPSSAAISASCRLRDNPLQIVATIELVMRWALLAFALPHAAT
jgi:hypothetical protein